MEIKNDRNNKTEINSNIRDTIGLALSVLVSWLGCYLFTMRLGIITSYPVIIITAIIASFISSKYFRTGALFALFGFLLPFIDSRGLANSGLLCIICLVIFTLSFVSVQLFRKKTEKKILYKVFSIVLIIPSLFISLFFNSDPITFSKNESILNDYIEKNYKYEKMNMSNVYYDFETKEFITETVYAKRPTERALISVSGDTVNDGYIKLTEGFIMEDPVQDLTKKLRTAFPEGKFTVEAGTILNYPRDNKVSAENTFDYSPYMSFNIYFNNSMNSLEFVDSSEKYFNAIAESGFICHDLTFYAGSAGKYYAKIETRFLSMKARFNDRIVKKGLITRRQ